MIDFGNVKSAALANIDAVLNRWAPGGKRQGDEYLPTNPTRSDSKLGSFSINLKTGAWGDFATGDKGGDLVALVAYIDGVKQSEAAARLAAFLGLSSPARRRARNGAADTQAPAQQIKPAWRALLPVPADAPQPPKSHPKHGTPSLRWQYRAASGCFDLGRGGLYAATPRYR